MYARPMKLANHHPHHGPEQRTIGGALAAVVLLAMALLAMSSPMAAIGLGLAGSVVLYTRTPTATRWRSDEPSGRW